MLDHIVEKARGAQTGTSMQTGTGSFWYSVMNFGEKRELCAQALPVDYT
jgi:hypothetical protein